MTPNDAPAYGQTVTLKKTFTDEESFNHFEKLYNGNPYAFEQAWERTDGDAPAAAPAASGVKAECLALFQAKVKSFGEEHGLTEDQAWEQIKVDMFKAEDEIGGAAHDANADPATPAPDAQPSNDTEAKADAA